MYKKVKLIHTPKLLLHHGFHIKIFHIPFFFLQNPVCILNLQGISTQISLEILDLYLDFIKFTIEKVNSHTQVVSNILNFLIPGFPVRMVE